MRLALKVDVDTHRGLWEGVPRLLEIFRRQRVAATFFVTMGPDRSGLALRRLFRKGFLWKIWRTGGLRMYGWRTVLSGTLLRARPVGEDGGSILGAIRAEGHELGIHGYDHVRWQDELHRLSAAEVTTELARALWAFEGGTGERPRASAAPGWQCTPTSLAIQDHLGFAYASDTRGWAPFYPAWEGRVFRTLQVPTTLPTMDEGLGVNGCMAEDFGAEILARLAPDRLNVHTIHAEVEGGPYAAAFEGFLRSAVDRGVTFVRLGDEAERINIEIAKLRNFENLITAEIGKLGNWEISKQAEIAKLRACEIPSTVEISKFRNFEKEVRVAPVCSVSMAPVPGRAGLVAWQGALSQRPLEG